MSIGTDFSFGSWLMANTAWSLSPLFESGASTMSLRALTLSAEAFWPSQKTAVFPDFLARVLLGDPDELSVAPSVFRAG